MAYTANKKPGGLTQASSLANGDNVVVDQSGDVKRATLEQVEAKVFSSKTAKSPVDGTEVVVVRQTDNALRQVALDNIVKPLLITNAMVSNSADIVDSKLAQITSSNKVANSATTATSANTASAIVARDGSGNFNAGTITATLSGNASTATNLSSNRTFALTGDVTGSVSSNLSSGASIATSIAAGTIVDTDISGSAGITLSKLATGALPTGITVASANIVNGTIVNDDVASNAAITHSKLANITAGQVLLGNASNVPTATALSGDVTVNSSGVTAIGAGVIVNADINASAAIDGSKIAPNFGASIVSGGRITLNGASAGGVGTITSTSSGAFGPGVTLTNTALDSTSPNIVLSKFRGAGAATDADSSGRFVWQASDGTNSIQHSMIDAKVDGAPSTGSLSGRLEFYTRATTGNLSEKMRIDSVGNVGIGKNNPATRLDVNGTVTATAFAGPLTGNVTGNLTGTASAVADNAVTNAKVATGAAIAHNKLANITAGQVLLGNASNVPTATALSGDVTVNSSGVTAIGSGVIVDDDIKSDAAIAGSKLADGGVATAKIADSAITAGKLSNSATVGTGVGYVRQTGSGGSPPSNFAVIQGPTGTRIAYAWGITGAASTSAVTQVTFPVTFSSTPRVTATVTGILFGFTRIVQIAQVGTTFFDFHVRDQNGSAQANPIDWIAIGPVA